MRVAITVLIWGSGVVGLVGLFFSSYEVFFVAGSVSLVFLVLGVLSGAAKPFLPVVLTIGSLALSSSSLGWYGALALAAALNHVVNMVGAVVMGGLGVVGMDRDA